MGTQHIFDLIVLIAWAVLLLVWAVSAFFTKPYASRGHWWLWRLIAVIIFITVLQLNPTFGRSLTHPVLGMTNVYVVGLGAVIAVAGVMLALWARYHLGRNWGMPASLKQGAQLVTSGPYAYIRNPIYSAFLLAYFGSALAITAWWMVGFVIFGIYFVYAAKAEEKIMAAEFPSEYPAYKARTKMLIPFIL